MAIAGHQPRGKRWELLGNRNFMLLWCAYGISAMGDHLSEMAILKTQNAVSSEVDVTPLDARMTFLFFVPFFLLAPITGWLADRLPRRGLMIVADLARFGLMLIFATLIAWATPLGAWGPFLPLLMVGAFAATFSPARSALLPTLIRRDQLVRANGMISGLGVIGTMMAIQIGGYLAEHYEPIYAFRIDAATFALSAILLFFLRAPRRQVAVAAQKGIADAARELAAGFRYAACHRRVLELLAVAALVWFCGPLVKCVIPAVVRDVYGGGYQAMSSYRALLGLGFICGAVVISVLGSALRSEIAITWGLIGIGVSISIFALSTFLPFEPGTLAVIGGVGVVFAGLFGISVMASLESLLQRVVPNRFRGRVFGVRDVGTAAALLTATASLGLPRHTRVDQWVGYILLAVAVITITAGLVTLRVRLKRFGLGARLMFSIHANEFFARFWWRVKCVGRCTVPREGPIIITANHVSSADPLFLYAVVRHRPISFLVAAEYMKWPIAGAFMRLSECIPVRRGTRDTSATKQAIRQLRAGKAVGIFIQGRTVPPGETVEPKDGVAMLALKTGVDVIPAHISGAEYRASTFRGLFVRHNARVRFGKRIDLNEFRGEKPNRDTLRAATDRIFSAIMVLAPKAEETTDGAIPDSRAHPRQERSYESV